MNAAEPLWAPNIKDMANGQMARFSATLDVKFPLTPQGFDQLHQWSIENRGDFWNALWDYCGIIGDKGEIYLENENQMPGAKFFPQAKINFAENLLHRRGSDAAIHFKGEDKVERTVSWDELHDLVSRLQQAFIQNGVRKGDRIAAMMPNMPETVAAMLAATSIGALWSSCSPDFGEKGVLDRFLQIEPVLFITCDGYWYNGKQIDVVEKLKKIAPQLSARKNIIVPYLGQADQVATELPNGVTLDGFIEDFSPKEVEFERLPFDHPIYILFSSGTTGIPKCIVHSAGGVLTQHLKEHQLHGGVEPGDVVFYFTTCGWMMWNWLVTALASEATLALYDGSPFYPDGNILFDYADKFGITFFGTSAKFIDALRNQGLRPIDSHDLSAVRVIASTGSPLAPENFAYVYSGIKSNVHLASVSGGTDIVSCFVGGVPWKPVYAGEIQGPSLGMATAVWNDDGEPVRIEKGELVCTKAFPSMPVKFWNDEDGSKYSAAYFERFDNIWCHGDFAEWSERGGMIIHGRSDATLNPGGVRIGTAEIYNQVEQMGEVLEALCIGQEWDNDTRVILFVVLAEGVELDDDLVRKIKLKIRTGASPRHVPAKVIPVKDIPRTKSGKITELAVRDIVHGRKVKNQEALANPEALEIYENLSELST